MPAITVGRGRGYISWTGGIYFGQGDTYLGQGVPTLHGGYLSWMGIPTLNGRGTYLGQGVLTLDKGRYPLSKVGTLPRETEQQSEYLLRGGRYASCVHAGGLSCLSNALKCRRQLSKIKKVESEATPSNCSS